MACGERHLGSDRLENKVSGNTSSASTRFRVRLAKAVLAAQVLQCPCTWDR
jgi:hypothetical protein